ncbi:copper resistance CopC/CopD family protein [Nocardioides marmorisolisilvae]|uniref:Copper resistance protein CopC n=1 Tax=Nocardioides marmorisolisilvae TaxID=1542737 RepID=A0A3N0E0F9_9ACTN|nr:copper resistance protein CopC [Nocardioides marmorisolisilvae]RNL81331.1 hypothetical protein EFL95_02980 [Nocardioides marmorisolisilvae]
MSNPAQLPPCRRAPARLVAALVLALFGLVLGAGPASAHTELLGSDPAQGAVVPTAPGEATLRFNEPIRVVTSAVHLFTAEGAELATTARAIDHRVVVDLPGAVATGTYTLAWRVISADGHPVAGALTFSVGAPSPKVTAPTLVSPTSPSLQLALGAVQALVYLAMFLAIGLVVFRQLLLPASVGTGSARDALLRVARRAADVGIAASLLVLPLTTINQRGDRLSALFEARSWEIDLSDPEPVAAILAMLGLALAVTRSARGRIQAVLPLAAGAVALGSLALVGHSRSSGPAPMVITSDVLHVLAGSVWFGGLVGLALVLRRLRAEPETALRTVDRFSMVATGLLVAVGASGTLLTWRILRSWHGFVDTSFGQTLLVKLALVAVVVVLAAINRWRLLPRLRREVGSGATGAGPAVDRLRRAVRIEGLVLVGVLAVTGVLVDRTPERPQNTSASTAPTPRATATADGITVTLELDPARVGSNAVSVSLTDGAGSALTPYAAPTLTLVHGDVRLTGLALTEHLPGTYHSESVLPKAGSWTAEVTVRTDEFDARVIPVRFRVGR